MLVPVLGETTVFGVPFNTTSANPTELYNPTCCSGLEADWAAPTSWDSVSVWGNTGAWLPCESALPDPDAAFDDSDDTAVVVVVGGWFGIGVVGGGVIAGGWGCCCSGGIICGGKLSLSQVSSCLSLYSKFIDTTLSNSSKLLTLLFSTFSSFTFGAFWTTPSPTKAALLSEGFSKVISQIKSSNFAVISN